MKPTAISHGPMDSNSLHPCPDLGSLISNFSISNFLSTIIDRFGKNRCSYVVYSDAFRRLPETVKGKVLARMRKVPAGTDPGIDRIGASERKRISRILEETFDGWNPEEK